MFQARQGDVFIISCDEIDKDAEELPRDEQKRIVLAYGEVTGHAHAIKEDNVRWYRSPANSAVFLHVIETVNLVHEEHTKVKIPPGNYRVIRQREYSPEEIRTVAD